MRRFLLVVLLAGLVGVAAASDQCQIPYGVPFASELDRPVANYNRASDRIATAGELTPEDITTLWDMGFDVVVDVRPAEPDEVRRERELAEAQGLAYYHLPYTDDGVAEADLATFNALIADPKDYRILVHCERGSRAGAMLTSHYLSIGAERQLALIAGRAAGLRPGMEAELIARLDAR
jgi:uncharacterized protein (TIGR01244 family)